MTFEEIGVAPQVIRAIKELGFEKPLPIQEKIIPIVLSRNADVTGLAQTGTGKTAAFGIPVVQQTDVRFVRPQVLIMSPTRELCVQIANDINKYAKYTDGLKILAVYGGANISGQIRALRSGVHVIVATPGRLLDLIGRKAVNLSSVYRVVLDEADEMLNMGFVDDINLILEQVPQKRNTMLFSATMPVEIQRIAMNYMRNPEEVLIGGRNSGAEHVKHLSYTVHAKDKYLLLKRIVDFYPDVYGIVFCRTRRDTQEVADKLSRDGYNADSLHGDLSQQQRDHVMQRFRTRSISLLVATDVAARGLDVNDLTHVIHYSLPDDHEVYTHRSGRTGRVGKAGISVAITHLREKHAIRKIEQNLKVKFVPSKVPSGREICEKQLFNLIGKMENVEMEHSRIDSFLPAIYKNLEELSKEEVIKRFVSLEFNRFLNYYQNAQEIIQPVEQKHPKAKNERRSKPNGMLPFDGKVEEGFSRIFINQGKIDGLVPAGLIEMINKNTHGKKIPVGRIDLLPKYSFFEVDRMHAAALIENLNSDAWFRGNKVNVEPAQPEVTFKQREKRKFNKSKNKFGKKTKKRLKKDKIRK